MRCEILHESSMNYVSSNLELPVIFMLHGEKLCLWWISFLSNSPQVSKLSTLALSFSPLALSFSPLALFSNRTSVYSRLAFPLSLPFHLQCISANFWTTRRKWIIRGNLAGISFHIQLKENWGWFFFSSFFHTDIMEGSTFGFSSVNF